jgi:hypothetical protein
MALFLLITSLTGMFLRPPLLALIGYTKVGKIPHTELDTPNPWYDQLRRIHYQAGQDRFIIAGSEGFYYSDDHFTSSLREFPGQPPVSIMGVTVLDSLSADVLLVGSFEGLFAWNTENGTVYDYIRKVPYHPPTRRGPPIGDYKISGYSRDFRGTETAFEYGSGALTLAGKVQFPAMPEEIVTASPMSLWNLALEVHTARIYHTLIGNFYLLIIPLTGLFAVFITISGFVVWYRHFRDKGPGWSAATD